MTRTTAAVLIILAMLAAGCAPGPNALDGIPDGQGQVAGFWLGLWHGFIALFTFIVSLFDKSVNVYEVHNSGGWYDLGFIIGLMLFFGGGGGGAGSQAKRRRKKS